MRLYCPHLAFLSILLERARSTRAHHSWTMAPSLAWCWRRKSSSWRAGSVANLQFFGDFDWLTASESMASVHMSRENFLAVSFERQRLSIQHVLDLHWPTPMLPEAAQHRGPIVTWKRSYRKQVQAAYDRNSAITTGISRSPVPSLGSWLRIRHGDIEPGEGQHKDCLCPSCSHAPHLLPPHLVVPQSQNLVLTSPRKINGNWELAKSLTCTQRNDSLAPDWHHHFRTMLLINDSTIWSLLSGDLGKDLGTNALMQHSFL